jgi:hypothetical protein
MTTRSTVSEPTKGTLPTSYRDLQQFGAMVESFERSLAAANRSARTKEVYLEIASAAPCRDGHP